jgi:hypothetical protein
MHKCRHPDSRWQDCGEFPENRENNRELFHFHIGRNSSGILIVLG